MTAKTLKTNKNTMLPSVSLSTHFWIQSASSCKTSGTAAQKNGITASGKLLMES